jgi:hypothetical protein
MFVLFLDLGSHFVSSSRSTPATYPGHSWWSGFLNGGIHTKIGEFL